MKNLVVSDLVMTRLASRRLGMRSLLVLVLVASFGGVFSPPARAGNDIIGLWLSEYQDGVIELFVYENRLRGRLVWIMSPVDQDGNPQKDVNNPDPSRRDDAVLGMTIVWGFERKEGSVNEWGGGWIYDPDNGKTYKCKIRLNEDGVLDIRGYIMMSLFGRTTKWTRVTPEEMAELENRGSQDHRQERREH